MQRRSAPNEVFHLGAHYQACLIVGQRGSKHPCRVENLTEDNDVCNVVSKAQNIVIALPSVHIVGTKEACLGKKRRASVDVLVDEEMNSATVVLTQGVSVVAVLKDTTGTCFTKPRSGAKAVAPHLKRVCQ